MYFQRPYDFQGSQYYYQKQYSPKPVVQSPQYPSSSPYYVPSISLSPSEGVALLQTRLDTPTENGVIDALTQDLVSPQSGDSIDSFFASKRAFVARSVEDILGLIYERQSILYNNLRQITYEESDVKQRLWEIERWKFGMNPPLERVSIGIEQELRKLESDKRQEGVECFRDVARLKTELREAVREFSQEQRKADLMGAQPGSQR